MQDTQDARLTLQRGSSLALSSSKVFFQRDNKDFSASTAAVPGDDCGMEWISVYE
jgi:hypothetical protein